MNPSNSSSAGAPSLKLTRRVSYITDTVAPEPAGTGQLDAEFEALREREANLQAYEAKLRAWQEKLDAAGHSSTFVNPAAPPVAGSRTPFVGAGEDELSEAWEKFHRARALLQAEQNQLRDDRMALRDHLAELERREAAVTAREAAVAAFEQQMQSGATEKPVSAVRRLTQAPFMAARSVFGTGR